MFFYSICSWAKTNIHTFDEDLDKSGDEKKNDGNNGDTKDQSEGETKDDAYKGNTQNSLLDYYFFIQR